MKTGKWISLSVLNLMLLGSCSRNLAPTGHYQDAAITVDGDIRDWPLPLRFSNPEYSMQYSVSNNDSNIYVCVYTKDVAFQKRILKNGLIIYFDPKGEKNKTAALTYPIRKPTDPADHTNGNLVRYSDYQASINQLLLQSDYYNTSGFQQIENGQYDIKATQTNIRVAMKFNSDSSLVYEASVPIAYALGKNFNSDDGTKNFSVGIVVNSAASTPRTNNNGYSGHGMHGGGMHGGGMGGGHHYGQSPNNSAPQKAEENWYTFRLVYKKPG